MQLPKTTINSNSTIRVRRLLPVPGEIMVYPGRDVKALTVIARAEMPSRYRVIDVARQLGQARLNMEEVMLAGVGDVVEANQVIAARKGALPFLQRSIRAPAEGRIAQIGPGWVLLETDRTTVEVQAFIDGIVNRVIGNQGVIIETKGTLIEAACGFGGEAHGQLRRLVNSPYEALKADAIDENVSESIILAGQTVDEEAIRQAEAWQVRGIIVGSIDATLLKLDPPVKVRVVATEGFGNVPMSAHTFGILVSLGNKAISIRGTTPHLGGASTGSTIEEPPIIVASGLSRRAEGQSSQPGSDVGVGSRVHVTWGTLLGASGIIDSIPSEPQAAASGIIIPGVNVKVGAEVHYIPWSNLEQIA